MNQDPCDWHVRTVLGLLLTLIVAIPATAQTTVGFADPHDLQALLDYRLPTWNYRTWTVSGNLAGGGWDYTGEGSRNLNNRFQSNLASDLAWAREAETTTSTPPPTLIKNSANSIRKKDFSKQRLLRIQLKTPMARKRKTVVDLLNNRKPSRSNKGKNRVAGFFLPHPASRIL